MKDFNVVKNFLFICMASAVCILYTGCSSSSDSIRYNEKQRNSKNENTVIRFSSEKEQHNNADTSQVSDSLNFANDTSGIDSDPDDIPPDNANVDISNLLKKYSGSGGTEEFNADKSNLREKMLMEIIKYLNTPYKYGGDSKKGIDCSAFTQTIYEKAFSITLERSARQQFNEGEVIRNMTNLKFGDLVFFNTRRWVRPGHVGIYIGDDLFAHASVKYGVTISSLNDAYYSRRFMGGRRIENLLGSTGVTGNN